MHSFCFPVNENALSLNLSKAHHNKEGYAHEDGNYSIGNRVAEEFKCITHGHEQWRGHCLMEWAVLGGGRQREKIKITVIAQ